MTQLTHKIFKLIKINKGIKTLTNPLNIHLFSDAILI